MIIEPIANAADLWYALNIKGGIQQSFYDKDLIDGNESIDGLYQVLNIVKNKSFIDDLKINGITIEKLLNAIFNILQPYGMMMNDLCSFFERYKIRKENKTLQIEFDFAVAGEDNLNFNLENFRETISKIKAVKTLYSKNNISVDYLWTLKNIIYNKGKNIKSRNEDVKFWIKRFEEENYIEEPNITIIKTGDEKLDFQLDFCMRIWKSYVNGCRSISFDREIALDKMRELNEKNTNKHSTLINSWPIDSIFFPFTDFWPSAFLNTIFYRVEKINLINEKEKRKKAAKLSSKLSDLLESFPIITSSEDKRVNELIDLLNLPIWDKRHELYSAWILTNIEKSFKGYPLTVHHEEGVLKIPFKPKKLMTASSVDGELLIFSEMLTQVDNLDSVKRKDHVQPDYVIFKNLEQNEKAFAVIEVKQYRKPSNSNFGAAIRDYSIAFNYADVFLVNYGRMSKSLKLYNAKRNIAFGNVYPNSSGQKQFISELKNRLPKSVLPKFMSTEVYKQISGMQIKHLVIDVSSSMLTCDPASRILASILEFFLSEKTIGKMIAVDNVERQIWNNPNQENITEVVNLKKGFSTDFNHLLPKEIVSGLAIITDSDGEYQLENYKLNNYLLIVIVDAENITFSFKE